MIPNERFLLEEYDRFKIVTYKLFKIHPRVRSPRPVRLLVQRRLFREGIDFFEKVTVYGVASPTRFIC